MSFQLVQDCIDMDAEMSSSCFAVLVVICRCANDDGVCYPTTDYLIKHSHLSHVTVRSCIRELVSGGWISVSQEPGKKRYFYVNGELLVENKESKELAGDKEVYPLQELAGGKELEVGKELGIKGVKNLQGGGSKSLPRISKGIDKEENNIVICPSTEEKTPKSWKDSVPYQCIADSYNEILGSVLPRCREINQKRRTSIKSLWLALIKNMECENKDEGVEAFNIYFRKVSTVDWIMGRTQRNTAHSNWVADFDFVVRMTTYTKIREGAYR